MKLIRSTPSEASAALGDRIISELQAGKQVLWLLSGGSNIQVTVAVMARLPESLTEQLVLALIDERFGTVGHAHSNWAGLLAAGLQTGRASVIPLLQDGLDQSTTASAYAKSITESFATCDVAIAQLGIGEDGHTAGILPRSGATEDTTALVVSYDSTPFKRISLSFAGLRTIDVAFVLAFGPTKKTQLQRLMDSDLTLDEQPAQILKAIHEAYVYNDSQEETI